MLSLAMLPLIRKLNRRMHLPWNAAVIIVLLFSVSCVLVLGTILISSLRSIFTLYPKFEERFMAIYEVFAETFKLPFNESVSLADNLWGQISFRTIVQHYAFSFSRHVIAYAKNLILVIFLILFFLGVMHCFRDKIDAAFHDKVKGRVINVFKNIILEVTRFISIKFIVSLATGVCIGLGTFFLGLDFPVIWGFIAFVLNFIPIFGSAFSCILTIVYSIVQCYPNATVIILTAVLMFGTNMIIGNLIEPHIVGHNLGLSPFIVIVSLSLWGWMWGFAGMILAVPVTVILKIICENISFLHPVAILLGDKIEETETHLSPVSDEDGFTDEMDTTFPDLLSEKKDTK